MRIYTFFKHCLFLPIFKATSSEFSNLRPNSFRFLAGQTSTIKLPAFFWRFQAKECIVRVNKGEITEGNTFKGDHCMNESNSGLSKNQKAMV